jgi:hypothetical protein
MPTSLCPCNPDLRPTNLTSNAKLSTNSAPLIQKTKENLLPIPNLRIYEQTNPRPPTNLWQDKPEGPEVTTLAVQTFSPANLLIRPPAPNSELRICASPTPIAGLQNCDKIVPAAQVPQGDPKGFHQGFVLEGIS